MYDEKRSTSPWDKKKRFWNIDGGGWDIPLHRWRMVSKWLLTHPHISSSLQYLLPKQIQWTFNRCDSTALLAYPQGFSTAYQGKLRYFSRVLETLCNLTPLSRLNALSSLLQWGQVWVSRSFSSPNVFSSFCQTKKKLHGFTYGCNLKTNKLMETVYNGSCQGAGEIGRGW